MVGVDAVIGSGRRYDNRTFHSLGNPCVALGRVVVHCGQPID